MPGPTTRASTQAPSLSVTTWAMPATGWLCQAKLISGPKPPSPSSIPKSSGLPILHKITPIRHSKNSLPILKKEARPSACLPVPANHIHPIPKGMPQPTIQPNSRCRRLLWILPIPGRNTPSTSQRSPTSIPNVPLCSNYSISTT